MAFRVCIFIVGFGLAIVGGVSIIAYLNLLTTGHGFDEYFIFVASRLEFYGFPIGIIMLWICIYYPVRKQS